MKFLLLILFFIMVMFQSTNAQGLFSGSIAEEDKEKIAFHGYARSSAYFGSEAFDYSSLFGELAIKAKFNASNAFLKADIRSRTGLFFDHHKTELEIKEIYAGYQSEKLDVFMGQQIVTWGRADGFNPTNNITPNNYFFLSAEPDDQKIPNFLIRAKLRFKGFLDFDVIGIPLYKPSVYHYNLFDLGENVNFSASSIPEYHFNNMGFAARFNAELSRAGFSISWFNGYDPFYVYRIGAIDLSANTPSINYITEPYHKNTFGADLSVPLGSFIIRLESAYNITKDYADSINVPNPNLSYVLGLESIFFDITTILQYVGKYNMDYTDLEEPALPDPVDPMDQLRYARESIVYETELFSRKIFCQQEELNHALSLTFSRYFKYNTIKTEFSTYYNITSEEYVIRPSVKWNISDALSFTTGAFYAEGPEGSLFDYSSTVMNGIFIEIKVNY